MARIGRSRPVSAYVIAPNTGGVTNIFLSDTMSATESMSVTATFTLADTATFSENFGVLSPVTLAGETLHGTESMTITVVMADTGTLVDKFTDRSFSMADVGSFVEANGSRTFTLLGDSLHYVESLLVNKGVPPNRTFVIRGEHRTMTIAAENRTLTCIQDGDLVVDDG